VTKTIAIIPARGGSKGIPRKNLIDFCDAPLLSWSIAVALNCPEIDSVFVSTDDPEIATCAESYGARSLTRPTEISGDTASSESALINALEQIATLERGTIPSTVVFLQATSPLRESFELSEALRHFREEKLDSLFAAAEPEDYLLWQKRETALESLNYDYRSRKRRQDGDGAEKLLIETGSFYITRTALLLESGNRLGGKIGTYDVPVWKSFEIDSLEGLEFCQLLMRHHKLEQVKPKKVGDL